MAIQCQWYYTHGGSKVGPCSGRQLKDLAASGGLLPTDTVWQEGVEKGVPAARVKNLFRAAPVETAVETAAAPPPAAAPAPEPVTEPVTTEKPRKPAARKRAMAIRGAVIVGQDGQNVRYRKNCTECGYEDTSASRMQIRPGVTRDGFFCRQCRKRREVEIQGFAS